MAFLTTALQVTLLILVVLALFNIIIFVHELGHFWAAKWRGLQIDRFQIWFGKPIWKKTINGVQYGLGWIPAGGFVALPQMAPMESIEGGNREESKGKPLPPIKPLDKIIVAFAGPLFSMLLALLSAVIIWGIGKPKDMIPTQTIGYVEPGSPADENGLKAGDVIIAINGEKVDGFRGSLQSITERIILSATDKIVFTVKREGVEKPFDITTDFEVPDTKWYERGGLRKVGIQGKSPLIVYEVAPNSPAQDAGLSQGDTVTHVDGQPVYSWLAFKTFMENKEWQTMTLTIASPDGSVRDVEITPERPKQPKGADPQIGVRWDGRAGVDTRIINPGPFEQVGSSVEMMWITVSGLANPNSEVNFSHLSGPVGIGGMMFDLIQTEDGWRRIIAFMVLFNVNLAILNMLPMPVLDGGHITLAILEKVFGKPVGTKPLEIIQTACALALISLMLYVTSKDVSDRVGGGGEPVVFPE